MKTCCDNIILKPKVDTNSKHFVRAIVQKDKMFSHPSCQTSGNVQGFLHQKMDRTWLCTGITIVPKVVKCCSQAQKEWQVF